MAENSEKYSETAQIGDISVADRLLCWGKKLLAMMAMLTHQK
jgi:hypothetical protein